MGKLDNFRNGDIEEYCEPVGNATLPAPSADDPPGPNAALKLEACAAKVILTMYEDNHINPDSGESPFLVPQMARMHPIFEGLLLPGVPYRYGFKEDDELFEAQELLNA